MKEALRAAEEAAATAASFRPTTESVLELIRDAEVRGAGRGARRQCEALSAQADVLMRKWLRFLLIVAVIFFTCGLAIPVYLLYKLATRQEAGSRSGGSLSGESRGYRAKYVPYL